MKLYTDSQAKQQFSDLLTFAEHEEVIIKRKDGILFLLIPQRKQLSPFDVQGINASISTAEIIDAVRESRQS